MTDQKPDGNHNTGQISYITTTFPLSGIFCSTNAMHVINVCVTLWQNFTNTNAWENFVTTFPRIMNVAELFEMIWL